MVQSVELLLEPEAEHGVVRVWEALLEAGLPSQARHAAPSNRPHTTLVAVPGLTSEAESAVADAVRGRLPVDAAWGEVALFGRGPWVLVRLLDPSDGMRTLQAAVADACWRTRRQPLLTGAVDAARHAGPPGRGAGRRPGRRPRHRALRERQAPVGMPVLADAVRRWDGSRKREWLVAPAQT